MERDVLQIPRMTSQGLFRIASAPILNRVHGWQLLALGFSGWIALYSAAIMNFQRGLAELAGHGQGVCFAFAMALGGAEARKRSLEKRRRRKLEEGLAWTRVIPDEVFEEQLAMRYEALEYRLERVTPLELQLGFSLRVVTDGRTMLVHTGYWRQDIIDEENLVQLSKDSLMGLTFDRITFLTRAEVSESTRKIMSSNAWQVISGADFLNFTENLPMFAESRQSTEPNATGQSAKELDTPAERWLSATLRKLRGRTRGCGGGSRRRTA